MVAPPVASPAVPPGVAVLAPFASAGVFEPAEVHLAATVARLASGPVPDEVLLAVACAARAPRLGHVCVELDAVGAASEAELEAPELPWPDPDPWAEALRSTPEIVADPPGAHDEPLRPLVWDGRRLYLQRYWTHEERAADGLLGRAGAPSRSATEPGPDAESGAAAELDAALDALFGPDDPSAADRQRAAARTALTSRLAVVAGGPGTGKTRTIARLVAAAHRSVHPEGSDLLIALAAPTGKAAARMAEAVGHEVATAHADGAIDDRVASLAAATTASTLHRLLGWVPGGPPRHDASDPLPHDVVVVDEVSMVSLPLLARLLAAVRPDARLVLVGDPDQLVSVEAGTVMGDVVGAASSPRSPLAAVTTVLDRHRRFTADSPIADLAAAIRAGTAADVVGLLDGGGEVVRWVRDDDATALAALEDELVDAGAAVVAAAREGDVAGGLAAATRTKLLAATRRRPLGRDDWQARIEAGVAGRVGGVHTWDRWYVGRPLIVLANDDLNGIANGDVGIVVDGDAGPVVALSVAGGVRTLPPSRLDRVAPWWAMTIHKSQGSEFAHAVVSLPSTDSPILTRELLYTAVTRARERVTLVASEAAVRAAVDRPVRRAYGLRDRLVEAR
jgi:exodeoxyribonuclease V alpha subunit